MKTEKIEKRVWVVIQKASGITWCYGVYDSDMEAIGEAFMQLTDKREACADEEAKILPLEYLPEESGYKLQLKSNFENEDATMFIFDGYYQAEVEE